MSEEKRTKKKIGNPQTNRRKRERNCWIQYNAMPSIKSKVKFETFSQSMHFVLRSLTRLRVNRNDFWRRITNVFGFGAPKTVRSTSSECIRIMSSSRIYISTHSLWCTHLAADVLSQTQKYRKSFGLVVLNVNTDKLAIASSHPHSLHTRHSSVAQTFHKAQPSVVEWAFSEGKWNFLLISSLDLLWLALTIYGAMSALVFSLFVFLLLSFPGLSSAQNYNSCM